MSETHFTEIEAVVFDAYGTLFDIDAPLARRRERLGPTADQLNELWRRKQLEYSWLRTIMGKYTDFWHVTGEALDFAMAALGIDDSLLRAELMQTYLNLDAYPDAAGTLDALREKGLRTAILSNGSPTMLTAAVNRAGFTRKLDSVLSVDGRATYKPHPSIYLLAVEQLGVAAQHVAFISANGWDVAGAAAFGFQTAWINRKQAPMERLPAGPSLTITTLSALPDLIVPTVPA